MGFWSLGVNLSGSLDLERSLVLKEFQVVVFLLFFIIYLFIYFLINLYIYLTIKHFLLTFLCLHLYINGLDKICSRKYEKQFNISCNLIIKAVCGC